MIESGHWKEYLLKHVTVLKPVKNSTHRGGYRAVGNTAPEHPYNTNVQALKSRCRISYL